MTNNSLWTKLIEQSTFSDIAMAVLFPKVMSEVYPGGDLGVMPARETAIVPFQNRRFL